MLSLLASENPLGRTMVEVKNTKKRDGEHGCHLEIGVSLDAGMGFVHVGCNSKSDPRMIVGLIMDQNKTLPKVFFIYCHL